MSKVHNFENEFTMQIENVMPVLVNRLVEERHKFDTLTLSLHSVLGVVERALDKEGRGLMSIEYTKEPMHNANYVVTMEITITNLNDTHDIEIYYVGGESEEAVITGADDFAEHFNNLKGVVVDPRSGGIRFDLDTPPDALAESFAALFTEFYS